MDKNQIRSRLQNLLSAEPGILFAYLHGSFLDLDIYHDIDVAVYVAPPPSDSFDKAMALSIWLTRELHCTIDVQVLNDAPLGFQHQVLQGELLFTRNDDRLDDYIEAIANEYTAFSHFLPEYLEALTQ